MLNCQIISPGIHKCEFDIRSLYSTERGRSRFERMWPQFLASDPHNERVFSRSDDDTLTYLTESFIPTAKDERPPLLLLLGNPASHSATSGMCFSFEGDYREHRFWRAMRQTHMLHFPSDTNVPTPDWDTRNQMRKESFFSLEYHSPFRIGIDVYFSVPSAASDPAWSGVAGLRKLFGAKALRRLAQMEEKRINLTLQSFIPERGYILAFQKNAYEGLRATESPVYSMDYAKRGILQGNCKFNPSIRLVGCPPTRLLHSKRYQSLLSKCREDAIRYLNFSS